MKTFQRAMLTLTIFCSALVTTAQINNDDMYAAVVKGDTSALVFCLKGGGDVNYVKEQNWMRVNLLITGINKENVDVVKILLRYGADVNWVDGFYTTALMYAVNKNNLVLVKLLLDKKADVNHKDKQGNNAIRIAKDNKNNEILKLLEAQAGK